MADAPAPELSVIVPCLGRPDALAALLGSLRAQTLAADRFEVLVVDDGSEPPLAEAVPATLLEGVCVLRQPNLGPAAARNAALPLARGRLLVFLNADAVLAPDGLARHLAAHDPAGPPRAVLGRLDWLPRHRDALAELSDRLGLIFPYARAQEGRPLPFEFFWTGNLSVPAAAVREAGGFDDGFRHAIWEDLELGYRLSRAGVPLFYRADIRCGHDHAMTLDGVLRRAEWLGHEWVRFADAHGASAFRILGTVTPADMRTARDLLAGVLDQEDAHRARVREARELLARADAALAERPDAPRDAVLRPFVGPFEPLAEGLVTLSVMRGVLGGLLGYDPPAGDAHRERCRRLAGVHTLASPGDVELTGRLLESLPDGAELVVTHTRWLPAGSLPDDPRLHVVRVPAPLAPDATWQPVLDATAAGTLVFVDGTRVPAAAEWRAMARFLGVCPRVGAVGLGDRAGRPHASAQLTDAVPTAAVATPRAALEADRPGQGGTLLSRLAARDLVFAVLSPAGA